MKREFIGRVAAGAVMLTLGLSASALGQQADAARRTCDRQCLIDIGEQYLQALGAHDPSREPISIDAKYSENGIELKMPDGLWRTISKVGDYRLRVADPETGTIGIFSTMEENGSPLILSSRLKVRNRQIIAIETVVARREGAVAAGASAGFSPRPEDLRERPQFNQLLAPAERRPRWQLIQAADTYFRALENNNGRDHVPSFADDCHRIENGMATTNRPLADPNAERGALNMGCREAFGLGYYREDTRMRGMRFLAVDEERGLVLVNGFFDHDAALRSYKLNDGRTVNVSRTAPWTWMMSEIFKIKDGKIWQVEAVLLSAPYGIKPFFTDGVKTLSYQEAIEQERQ
jgi:hypothetical protein